MFLRTYFATRTIKNQLNSEFKDVELGKVTYVPDLPKGEKPQGTRLCIAHHRAEFAAVSRKDGTKVKGTIGYASRLGSSCKLFLTTVRPAT